MSSLVVLSHTIFIFKELLLNGKKLDQSRNISIWQIIFLCFSKKNFPAMFDHCGLLPHVFTAKTVWRRKIKHIFFPFLQEYFGTRNEIPKYSCNFLILFARPEERDVHNFCVFRNLFRKKYKVFLLFCIPLSSNLHIYFFLILFQLCIFFFCSFRFKIQDPIRRTFHVVVAIEKNSFSFPSLNLREASKMREKWPPLSSPFLFFFLVGNSIIRK